MTGEFPAVAVCLHLAISVVEVVHAARMLDDAFEVARLVCC